MFLSRTNLSPKAKTDALSAKTVRHYFNALKFILNEAVRDRYLEVSPAEAVRPVKVPAKIPVSLTEDELKKLWNTPAGAPFAEVVKPQLSLDIVKHQHGPLGAIPLRLYPASGKVEEDDQD